VTRLRTSLDRTPSAVTTAEIAARMHEYQAELYRRHRAVVVWLDRADGLPRLVTMSLDAWAKGRFR